MKEINTLDRLDLSIVKHEHQLKQARKELNNENLTAGQLRAVHVEIEKLKFSITTLKFIKS